MGRTQLEGPASTSSSLWLHSPADKPPLRVGILLDEPVLASFNARIIEHIQACDFAGINFLIYRKAVNSAVTPRPKSLPGRLTRRLFDSNVRKHTLYSLYTKFDERKKRHDHPLEIVDCSSLLSGIDSMEVEPIGKKFVHRFPPEAVQQIRDRNLDVLIRFGFNILKGDILTAARYGVWSYHHGDNDFYRGGPAHFWELYERNPISGVILQVLTEELDAGVVLCKSLFTTQHTASLCKNRFSPYWGATDMIIRKLNELHRFGWDYLQRHSVPPAPYRGKRPIYRTPTNWEMARWMAPVLVKKGIQRPFRKRKVLHWRMAIRMNATPLVDSVPKSSLKEFQWIDSTKGHFWADPFLLEQGGRKWVFYEDYVYARKRGKIACAEIAGDGTLLAPVDCLDDPQRHYSYPYVFRDGEELLMTPEASDSEAVDLYRCEGFPGKWVRQSTLLHGKYVDPTIWQHDGLWWLMVTSIDPDPRAACLFLFYAERLTGPWQFHPANPISTDVRNNRGAGSMLYRNGHWIRPSQSCCPVYGYSFQFNEVTKLSPTEYAERPVREFRPESLHLEGIHTYNWIPGLEIIDGAKTTPLTDV